LSGVTRSMLRRASSAALAASGKTILDQATLPPNSAAERQRQQQRSSRSGSCSRGGDDDASVDIRSSFAGPPRPPYSPSTSIRALRERALSERITYESSDSHLPYTPRVYWSSMPS
jgi:hypothetical protein